jgi:hypothetical protein
MLRGGNFMDTCSIQRFSKLIAHFVMPINRDSSCCTIISGFKSNIESAEKASLPRLSRIGLESSNLKDFDQLLKGQK